LGTKPSTSSTSKLFLSKEFVADEDDGDFDDTSDLRKQRAIIEEKKRQLDLKEAKIKAKKDRKREEDRIRQRKVEEERQRRELDELEEKARALWDAEQELDGLEDLDASQESPMKERRITVPVIPTSDDDNDNDDNDEEHETVTATTREPEDVTPATGVATTADDTNVHEHALTHEHVHEQALTHEHVHEQALTHEHVHEQDDDAKECEGTDTDLAARGTLEMPAHLFEAAAKALDEPHAPEDDDEEEELHEEEDTKEKEASKKRKAGGSKKGKATKRKRW
jgi:hypothetical protein